MARFAQQTRLQAAEGKAVALVDKFVEAADMQRSNPACEVMLAGVSASEADVVYLFEIWSSEAEWEQARTSDEITAWSRGMPGLVAGPPQSIRLDAVAGKGI
ncbi:MAG TPA: antibiotic biosynthesis monooxygenase [Acidimicrobiales bacterium]|nr:antibiotic biosynthesis monooxygenase [Acidimicrobiales bacterium]